MSLRRRRLRQPPIEETLAESNPERLAVVLEECLQLIREAACGPASLALGDERVGEPLGTLPLGRG